MANKKPTLVDDVLQRTKNSSHGFRTWHEMLPPDAQAELEAVRAKFDPSKHQKRAFAFAVIEACRERGWKTSGVQGVIDWLSKKP